MRRFVLIEILMLIAIIMLPKWVALSPYVGITTFIFITGLVLYMRRRVSKAMKSNDSVGVEYKWARVLNTMCLAFCVFGISNYILDIGRTSPTDNDLVENIVLVLNRVVIAWWIMIEIVRLISGLRVKNILIIFAFYIIFGFLASVGFDYMTTAVVLVYAFATGFFQTERGKMFKADYGLSMGDEYSFVDVDFLLAIIFLSYILVKATGISDIFVEFEKEESLILHTIDSSLWDGGLMLIISGVLMYFLLEKGLVYRIYDVLDRFLRGLMEDLNMRKNKNK